MAIIHDVEQGSAAWFKLRRGIPTASEFDKIVTPAKGELSKSWKTYAAKLLWEKLLNTTTQSLEGIKHVEDGKMLEPAAVQQFEFTAEVVTRKIGFVTTDDGLIGASPDRYTVEARPRAVEIKCPTGPVHMGYLLFGHNDAYRPQIQGQLHVCELGEGVFYSYHERAPAHAIATARDEPYIRKLREALAQFLDELQNAEHRARGLGVFQEYHDIATPLDAERGEQMRGETARILAADIDDLEFPGYDRMSA